MEELADLTAGKGRTSMVNSGLPTSMRVTVEERLRSMGVDPAFEKEKTLAQLESIQRAIDEEALRIEEARKIALRGMPTTAVSELSGISRQTFYNKPLLKEYAERAINDAGVAEDRNVVTRLKETVAEQKSAIDAFVRRDGELVEMEIKLRDVQAENDGLKAALSDAKETIEGLRKLLRKAGIGETSGNIIPMQRR